MADPVKVKAVADGILKTALAAADADPNTRGCGVVVWLVYPEPTEDGDRTLWRSSIVGDRVSMVVMAATARMLSEDCDAELRAIEGKSDG